MNRKELVDELSQRFEGNRDVAAHALDSVVDVITKSISAGEKVVISGFGEFERRARDAGARAGEYVPEFKPGKELREVVSGTREWRDRVTGSLAVVPAAAVEAAEQASRAAAGTLRSVADKARELAGELATFGDRGKATSSTARRGQASKKAPAKKTTAKKTTAKKAPAKKAPAKKTTAKKAPAKGTAKKTSTAKTGQSATGQSTAGEQQSGT